MPASKRLDEKLARIRAGRATRADFIVADAKDADMAFGVTAPGPGRCPVNSHRESEGCWKTLEDYRQQIRDVVAQGIVDIVLLSTITTAARANDTTDIWVVRGGKYPTLPSRSFRTAALEHIKYGRLQADCTQPHLGADLGLYSLTFTNNLDRDYQALQDFTAFRLEAETKHFRYFLEVFNPNVDPGIPAQEIPGFLNDHVVRTLAGVPSVGRPLFLKIPYNGPGPLEELVAYDPSLIIGILGGSAGTTFDAFQLIHDAQKYGAWAALFGRKINLSEHPLAFIEFLRRIVNGEIKPADAVRAYHAVLQKLGIRPQRPLNVDLQPSKTYSYYRR
jgi:hypothetical protein